MSKKYNHLVIQEDSGAGIWNVFEYCKSEVEAKKRCIYLNERETNYFLSYSYQKEHLYSYLKYNHSGFNTNMLMVLTYVEKKLQNHEDPYGYCYLKDWIIKACSNKRKIPFVKSMYGLEAFEDMYERLGPSDPRIELIESRIKKWRIKP